MTNQTTRPRYDEPADRKREKGWSWWYPMIVLVPALLALGALITSLLATPDSPGTLRGARLGMTPDQVRARFDEGSEATWRTEIVGPDLTLVRGPSASLDRGARFEFHNGMLVAMQLDLPPDAPEASGDPLEISTVAVRSRTRDASGRVGLRVLARDCPTHAEEVSRLLSDAP